ncbi:MAG: efflux RND transporter periplasmic adaptor subunit [Thermodesulfobacteriota bacterium]|nr:efflux RND transporter periplasmic adaptor subunit [Thermodesulfobacteriota bacterium]
MVEVASVTLQDVNPPQEYVGHMEAVQAVDLRARVEGFLEQVAFKEGSDVNTDDLLYSIEQGPYAARVAANKAMVAQAEATLSKSRQYLKRARTVRSGGVSATDLDNAVAEELRAKAQLEQTKANLTTSQINLDYTSISAPISGRIGHTEYTKGNLVNAASGVLSRIVQLDPIRVVYSISENDLAAIQMTQHDVGQNKKKSRLTPRLKLADGTIIEAEGQIDFVDNQVDPATGTIAVRALFSNPDHTLLPGQYVTVMVSRSAPMMMPVVPQAAVLVNQQGHYVMMVDKENKAVARPVIVGAVVGNMQAVESGLNAGDTIIVQGIQKVRPGQTVQFAPGKVEGQ